MAGEPEADRSKQGRRKFLIGAGAVTVAVAGGLVWRGVERGAFSVSQGAPWELWETWSDDARAGTPLALIAAAVLAASPHNTQPWLFHVTENRIDLYADRSRNLGAFDPFLREMILGLGCALENMILAGPANGIGIGLSPATGSLRASYDPAEPLHVATLHLGPTERKPGVLYGAIGRRHTNRGPYRRGRKLPQADLAALAALANGVRQRIYLYTEGKERRLFDREMVQATEAIIADRAMSDASGRWLRLSHAAALRHRDGITLEANGLHPAVLALAKVAPELSSDAAHRAWLNTTREVHLATAPVTGFIAVRDLYDIPRTLDAGRLWQRLHLWATLKGIAMQPINQAVEMVDRELHLGRAPETARRLVDLTGDPAWKPAFAFRAGYARRAALPSPRRPLQNVVAVGGT